MNVINMPAKNAETHEGEEDKNEPKKIDKNSVAMNQANAILNKRKEEPKPTTMAG